MGDSTVTDFTTTGRMEESTAGEGGTGDGTLGDATTGCGMTGGKVDGKKMAIDDNNNDGDEYPIPLSEIEACFPAEEDPEMKTYFFHHVNYRIKDPKKTFKFYGELLGMRMVHHADCPTMRTSVYHLGYYDYIFDDLEHRKLHCHHHRSATIQFMYHWGTEKREDVKYASGNEAVGKGFSHICIKVPDIDKAAEKLIQNGVEFINKPNEASLSGYSYFKDPDGYWVELLGSHVHPIPGGEDKQEIIDAYRV